MAAIIEVKYYNSFWLKKVIDNVNASATRYEPVYPGSNPGGYNLLNTDGTTSSIVSVYPVGGGGTASGSNSNSADRNWEVEEARIRGGFNNTSVDFGVKAYIEDDNTDRAVERVESGIIYSGIFNSRNSVNETNQFPSGSDITKAADPHNGSIQKLYASNTDLIVLQENKVSNALIDKDAVYSAEGSAAITSSTQVIGKLVPYLGEYGISKNPESFATYGFRKYWADKYRGVVCRLSRDGITEISDYGMFDYFRDTLKKVVDTPIVKSTADILVTISSNPSLQNILYCGASTTYPTNLGNAYSVVSNPFFTFPQTVANAGLSANNVVLEPYNALGPINNGSYDPVADITVDGAGNISFTMKEPGAAMPQSNFFLRIPAGALGGGSVAVDSTLIGSESMFLSSYPSPVGGDSDYHPQPGDEVYEVNYTTGAETKIDDCYVVAYGPAPVVDWATGIYIIEISKEILLPPTVDGPFLFRFKSKSVPRIVGGWDIHNKNYTLSMQYESNYQHPTLPETLFTSQEFRTTNYSTLAFDDSINGWISFYHFNPNFIDSTKGSFYSAYKGTLWQHYVPIENAKGNVDNYALFYNKGEQLSSITFIFNPQPSLVKNFLTVNYEGSNGWQVDIFESGETGYDPKFPTTAGWGTSVEEAYNTIDQNPGNVAIPAYDSIYNKYIENGVVQYRGFVRKENKYVSNIYNNSEVIANQVIIGQNGVINNSTSGIKGYYARVRVTNDINTDEGGPKELYAVGAGYVPSSY